MGGCVQCVTVEVGFCVHCTHTYLVCAVQAQACRHTSPLPTSSLPGQAIALKLKMPEGEDPAG